MTFLNEFTGSVHRVAASVWNRRSDHHWSVPLRRWYLGDKSCAALESDVVPKPAECYNEPVACLDQEIDVHHAPEQPAKEASEFEPPDLNHRGLASDGGEIAHMAIAKRRR